MRRSKNPDTIRSNLWRDSNKEKDTARRIRYAYRLLVREGVIEGNRVVFDPTKN